MHWWREIHNGTIDYLALKKLVVIVETTINDVDDSVFLKMIKWCKNKRNVKGSWGPGQLKEYNGIITFRFWQQKEAEKFMKRFKKYITNSQQIILK